MRYLSERNRVYAMALQLTYRLDMEFRLRFCACNFADYGCIYLVYRTDNGLEVRYFSISSKMLLNCRLRTRFRREANQADNRAASTAVDSLINYEAVKVQ